METINREKKFRVILKYEDPSTDIKNTRGVLIFKENEIKFIPQVPEINLERSYSMNDLSGAIKVSLREWLKKKEIILLQFSKKQVSVSAFFEPIDVSPDFFLQEILKIQEDFANESLPGVVGSWIEKIGTKSQKIVREVGAMIQSSSHDISIALDQTVQFIREATKAADILNSIETDTEEKRKTINLEFTDIDEILKRSLASGKIEAMISGLIAKGLISAQDHNFKEAMDALKIAREAAKSENMKDYTVMVEENINEIKNAESSESFDSELSEKAMRYANEARDIVANWEVSKDNEDHIDLD
ncbi:MAG: hypothetical protein ACXACR_07110 [Candidatus Hodarchaeales archaeon]